MFFFISFSMAMTACNKEDFYQKEYLQDPQQMNKPNGWVDPSDNANAQGGANPSSTGSSQGGSLPNQPADTSGSNGGSAAGTQSAGTSSGGDGSSTPGSTTGSSTGGSTGMSTGGSTSAGSAGTTAGGSSTGGDGSSTAGTSAGSSTGATTGATSGGSSTGASTGGSTAGGVTGGSSGVDCSQNQSNEALASDSSTSLNGCVTENFAQSASPSKKLDVVWVIDNSGSMADEQISLGENFSAFINDFILKDIDFKMAITTTDASSAAKKGRLVAGSDIKLTSQKAKENELQFKEDFKNLVYVGTSGSGVEKGLEASEGFMQKYASSFLRPDAYLAVVIISDEEDQSSKTAAEYANFLKSMKASAGLVKVYSIVDVNLTNSKSTAGLTSGYARYKAVSDLTSGSVANIRDDFYRTLDDMGGTIMNLLDSFALAHPAKADSVRVYVNGVETSSYSFDAASNAIKFNQGFVPDIGAQIIVRYAKL